LILPAAALALGLALPARAQNPDTAPAPTTVATGSGQLGSAYTQADLTYHQIDSISPSVWRGFALAYNQPLQAGLDFNFAYDWGRAEDYTRRLTQQNLAAGVTAYSPLEWGRPYVQALAGWDWRKGDGFTDSSFAYTLGTGVEFQVAPTLVLTPYVNFVRATSFNRSEFDYGAKAAYRLNKAWSLTASVQYEAVMHQKDGRGFTLGVAYHY
jgi:opacity protein-like surface antigen